LFKIINIIALFYVLLISFSSTAKEGKEEDTLAYKLYKNKVILFTDLGYNSAPFSVQYPFDKDLSKIYYRNNYKTVLGLGGAYKWLSLRVSFAIGQNTKNTEKFGTTDFRSFRASYTYKQTYCEFDLRIFRGFAIKNAIEWNDSLTNNNPNDIRPFTTSTGLSLNAWYFFDQNLNMNAFYGKKGNYKRNASSFYLKNTCNIYGVGNDKRTLLPDNLIDTSNSKTESPYFNAIDIGVIPGYAKIFKYKNWQFGGLFGLGAVIQNKYYATNQVTRGFLGLAPRYDIICVAGYTGDRRFVLISADFNNKSIRYNDLVYRQSFYHLKIIGGFRLKPKNKQKKIKN
jgi:hypothetical protein